MAEPEAKRMKPAAKDPDGEEGDVDAGGEAGYDVQSPEEQAALQELMACQEQLAEIDDEYRKEALALQRKFFVKKQPIMTKRAEATGKIGKFWYTVITGHPMLSTVMTVEDHQVLQYVKELTIMDTEENGTQGFAITMTFEENPHFSDESVTKSFKYMDGEDGVPVMVVEGQEPNWKPNGNPWSATEDDEGERGRKRLREAPQEGLFSWFMTSEALPAAESLQDADNIAHIFRQELYANPVPYWSGEALQQAQEAAHGLGEDDGEEFGEEDGEGLELDEGAEAGIVGGLDDEAFEGTEGDEGLEGAAYEDDGLGEDA